MIPDPELLARYVKNRDEVAFAELVRRHVDLVYATAIRLAQGNATLAEDASQAVFADLARKAGTLLRHPTLTGWLHTSTRYATLTALRKEQCRQKNDQEASAMNDPTHSPTEAIWTQLRPLLDETLSLLRERERDAVLLRFFEDKSYREVGTILGVSDNTAQMRVERALNKLRAQFSRRGVTTTAALLSSALEAHGASVPAPAGLAANIVSHSLAGAKGIGAAPPWFTKISWPIWAAAGAAAIFLFLLIFQNSPGSNASPAPQNSPTASSANSPPSINRGPLAATQLPTPPAATVQATTSSGPPPTLPMTIASAAPTQTPTPAAPPPALPVVATAEDVSALVAANNRFAVDLLHQINAKPNENIFFSPYSISTALAMTWAGAKGDTAAQLAKVLHFSDLRESSILAAYAALHEAVAKAQTLSGAQLAVANSLWIAQDAAHPILPGFLNSVQANFFSSITPVDFIQHSTDAIQQINSWVEEKTGGKIKNLLHPADVSPDTRLILINALYFKAHWANIFATNWNHTTDFHLADGSPLPVTMMSNEQMSAFADITDAPAPCQILSMAYSFNRGGWDQPQYVSFVAILPHAGGDLAALEKSLTAEQLAGWLGKLQVMNVAVHLPKFKLEQRYLLADTLQAMGVKDAFSPALADFSAMDGARDLHVSQAIHQTTLNVDEDGTEAAAATGMGIPAAVMNADFNADHPFLFLIRDNTSGAILFLGQLANPTPVPASNP